MRPEQKKELEDLLDKYDVANTAYKQAQSDPHARPKSVFSYGRAATIAEDAIFKWVEDYATEKAKV